MWPIRGFLVLGLLLIAVQACQTDDECSLNGICSPDSSCICDPGWRSGDCSELDLQPVERWTGYNHTNATGTDFYKQGAGNSSWGGHIIQDRSDKGLFHLITSQMSHGCGLAGWRPFSTIIRAESRTGPQGPYNYAQTLFSTFHHNPTTIWSPADQKFLIYFIGKDVEVGDVCRSQKWNNTISVINVTNPAPWPLWSLENPTHEILLAVEKNNIYHADNFSAPHNLVVEPRNTERSEDPFLWRDKRGHWHILVHHMIDIAEGRKGPRVGAHAYAREWKGPWTYNNNTLAYNTTVEFTDGVKLDYYRRERPKLYFSDDGQMTPLYLLNGVQEFNKSGSYTLIQPIGKKSKGCEKGLVG
ncbi:Putative EGF-like domain, glycosyl hydrolase, five-bladed beta-propellor domain superfamily [Colletotrichum destructivum]|uniref:EGF-like domain, glycosyl hydrolase, five-bladed beta-propellor domain superfamily n=1 Tax=Colletotrichum destructivum TaxID=34406 RepID=A0AAX4IMP7_9PEZI|nr:Putative EGF-like domain, glycosyl hydrolase, five-bladed beta-propellor domain superfamily [Colletotrichum destructivum]